MRPRAYYVPAIAISLSLCGFACELSDAGTMTLVTGTVTARTILVVSGATGEVKRVTKEPGDRVAQDELLMRLDPEDSAGELAKAKERLAAAADEEKKAKEELDRTTAEVAYSKGRYLTFAFLFKKGAVARREVDRLKDEWEFAETQHKKALAWHSRAREKLKEAETDLARAEGHYGSAMVMAPVDGHVVRVFTWEGGWLLVGDKAFEIAPAGEVSFVGTVGPDDRVSLGEEASVWPLAFPTGRIKGYVARIDDAGGGRRTVTVRLFPKAPKDVVNIGTRAWAILSIAR
jgi:multidrug resistance efflux pump